MVSCSQYWGNKPHRLLLGKYEKLFAFFFFCSQNHLRLHSLPRDTWKGCAIAHTKQWIIFVKLATLQWMNFMPRDGRDSVPAPNMISQV